MMYAGAGAPAAPDGGPGGLRAPPASVTRGMQDGRQRSGKKMIYGGSNEIRKNIAAKGVLGL